MRLIQNMSTIAEYPSTECPGGRILKIAVLGGSGVGKTALVVRFLTRRFIGDYERNSGTLYSREVQVDGEQVAIQVQDTPGLDCEAGTTLCVTDQVTRSIQWADAVVLVYSVTVDRSFDLIAQLHQHVRTCRPDARVPIVILANKVDLLHVRQVDTQRGLLLAATLGCAFCEVSASEGDGQVCSAFHLLCRELGKQAPPAGTAEKRRSQLLPRPKSPNMQDLKRRFRQVLSAKVRTATSV
ncbi:ras-like protein family member 11B [Paramormyrops kingsleyae]|uniref:small monomeric GTPase n=1 Tax=Paramormyrops kingsleyae TaxID=1676925 RepID=A0A3B3RGZ8_9TELE|nr:ras-like protein family member 11B [Paramormyrops kingsleyae]